MKKIISSLFLVLVLAIPFSIASAQETTPSIVTTTIPVDADIRAAVDVWLAESAPVALPYWAITYVKVNEADKFVSLAAINIQSPTATKWHITDENILGWMGSIIVHADNSVELYSDGGYARGGGSKLAMPSLGPGGGSNIRFPWQSGASMMYGPSGVHAAGGGGSYATGFVAVDFLGGDDLGSGVADNHVYAVDAGTVDYVCADNTTTLIRTHNSTTDDYYIYAHILSNASLEENHAFGKGSMIGSLKYGTFDDNCGWATQTAKHYHLHFGFKSSNNAFQMENCILSTSTEKWACGTKTVATGGYLFSTGSGTTGDDGGVSVTQMSFWDYVLSGAVSMWDQFIIANLPDHNANQFMYVLYNAIAITLKIVRVMVYSNLNLGHFMAALLFGFVIKTILGIAEFIVFLFKAWKSLVPIIGA
jgi:hypothetical protein